MDLEEYYDSLDEDSNYGSVETSEGPSSDNQIKNTGNVSKIPIKTKTKPAKIELKKKDPILTLADDIVPFYDHCLNKSEVEFKKMFSRSGSDGDGPKNKPRKKFTKKKIIPNVNGKLKSNSYLDMFYAKIGLEKIDLTNRATCADLTPKSYVTCEESELASSVYLSEEESAYNCSYTKNQEISLSLTSLDSKFGSVSQQNLKIRTIKSKKSYVKPSGIKVPELGRLGPEIPKEKLELLKKRQDYGQKVSQKNKIKMVEQRLLQNLHQEIKECKKIV